MKINDLRQQPQNQNPGVATIGGKTVSTVDSRGQSLGSTKEELVNFYRWFGLSHVVVPKTSSRDKSPGVPLVVYHGTRADFEAFESGHPAFQNYGFFGNVEVRRQGFFFATNPGFSHEFATQGEHASGHSIYPVYLSLKNPLWITEHGVDEGDAEKLIAVGVDRNWVMNHLGDPKNDWSQFDDEDGDFFVNAIKQAGFDGVRMSEIGEAGIEEVWVAFHPNQIKSAVGNTGQYNPESDKITEVSRQPLYHAMKLKNALSAISKNEIPGYTVQRYWDDGRRRQEDEPDYKGSKWLKGISTTRDINYAKDWGEVVLLLDWERLNQSYKIIPYHWGYHMQNTMAKSGLTPTLKREREEFIVTGSTGVLASENPDAYDDEDNIRPGFVTQKQWTDTPVGAIKPLNKFLIGFYVDGHLEEYGGDYGEAVQALKKNPKFLGFYERPSMSQKAVAARAAKTNALRAKMAQAKQQAAESITEARDYPLYHWMDERKAESVFTRDVMEARWTHTDLLSDKNINGNSFSRDKNLYLQKDIRIIVDGRTLSQTNKIIPLDAENTFRYGSFMQQDYDQRDSGSIEDKKLIRNNLLKKPSYGSDRNKNKYSPKFVEEFVLGDIRPLHRYVKLIEINALTASNDLIDICKSYSRRYKIPVRMFNRAAATRRQRQIDYYNSLDESTQINEIHYSDIYGKEFETFMKKYKKMIRNKEINPNNFYVQFTNHKDNTLDRSAYEDPTHSDPMGIYGYPLSYVLKYPTDIWYGASAQYLRVIYGTPKNAFDLKANNDWRYVSRALYRMGLDSGESHLRWIKRENGYTGKYAPIMTFMSAVQVDYDKEPSVGFSGNKYPQRSAKEQTDLFLKGGYDALIDTGTGAINNREPEQIIFFTRASFKVREVFTLKTSGGEDQMTFPDPNHNLKLIRKFASQIAQELGDKLVDKSETANLGGWTYLWTKDGRRIEIMIDRPQSFYNRKMGEKKHKYDKLSTDHNVRVKVQTEFGPIETINQFNDEKLSMIAYRIGIKYRKLKEEGNRNLDWSPETRVSHKEKEQRTRRLYFANDLRQKHRMPPLENYEQLVALNQQGLNALGVPFEVARRQEDERQLAIFNRALASENKPQLTIDEYVDMIENDLTYPDIIARRPKQMAAESVVLEDIDINNTIHDPKFQAWFKGSKVVDENGLPLICYHGTKHGNPINSFHSFSHFGTLNAAHQRLYGDKYSDDPEKDDYMRSHLYRIPASVYPVFLSIKNPIKMPDLENHGPVDFLDFFVDRGIITQERRSVFFQYAKDNAFSTEQREKFYWQQITSIVEDLGYDGFMYVNDYEDAGSISWINLYPDQIWNILAHENVSEASVNDDRDWEKNWKQGGYWGKAGAGCLIMAADTGRILFPLRSADVDQPHTWGTWGGKLDGNETPIEAASRECREEAGITPKQMIPLYVFKDGSFQYHNFLAIVPTEFAPRLDWETESAMWLEPGDVPHPMHPGLEALYRDQKSVEIIRQASLAAKEGDQD